MLPVLKLHFPFGQISRPQDVKAAAAVVAASFVATAPEQWNPWPVSFQPLDLETHPLLSQSWSQVKKGGGPEECETLFHLDLSYNSLSSADCEVLAEALKANHTLFGLHLAGEVEAANHCLQCKSLKHHHCGSKIISSYMLILYEKSAEVLFFLGVQAMERTWMTSVWSKWNWHTGLHSKSRSCWNESAWGDNLMAGWEVCPNNSDPNAWAVSWRHRCLKKLWKGCFFWQKDLISKFRSLQKPSKTQHLPKFQKSNEVGSRCIGLFTRPVTLQTGLGDFFRKWNWPPSPSAPHCAAWRRRTFFRRATWASRRPGWDNRPKCRRRPSPRAWRRCPKKLGQKTLLSQKTIENLGQTRRF